MCNGEGPKGMKSGDKVTIRADGVVLEVLGEHFLFKAACGWTGWIPKAAVINPGVISEKLNVGDIVERSVYGSNYRSGGKVVGLHKEFVLVDWGKETKAEHERDLILTWRE